MITQLYPLQESNFMGSRCPWGDLEVGKKRRRKGEHSGVDVHVRGTNRIDWAAWECLE